MTDTVWFLDVDGVLNRTDGSYLITMPAPGQKPPWLVDLNIVQSINRVLEQTHIKIVVSSTWRLHARDEDEFCERTGVARTLIHEDWRTKDDRNGVYGRWFEINEWIGRHPEVTKFVVLDDVKSAEVPGHPFVHTNPSWGLTMEQLHFALKKSGYTLQGSHKVQKKRSKNAKAV